MASTSGGTKWKTYINHQLRERNSRENKPFKDLVKAYNKLFEFVSTAQSKNVQLEIEVLQLKQENLSLQKDVSELSALGGSSSGASEKVATLEQKVFKLQEELTEIHKTKGENAEKVIELNKIISDKNEELSQKEAHLQDSKNNQEAIHNECKGLENTVMELELTNQTLKDELQALHMAFTSMEEKHRKLTEENKELVDRWLKEKAKDADKMNVHNEEQHRQKQQRIQEDILEAAKETVTVKIPYILKGGTRTSSLSSSFETGPPPPFCLITSIPSHPTSKFEAHDGEVYALRFSVSGRYFATGGNDKKINIWDMSHGHDSCVLKGAIYGSNQGITSVQFDSQEKLILGASNDQACRVWTVSDQRLRHTLTGHTNKVLSAKFLGDISRVVSGSHDRTLKIWDLRSKACVKTIFAGSSCNDLVTCDGYGSNIISGHFDRKIRFWDGRSDSCLNEITLPGKITSLDLSSDTVYLLACTRDDTLKLIDLRKNQVYATFSDDGFKVALDWSRACFSPDGQYVMCGSQDGSVFIWNSTSAKLEKVLKEHSGAVVVCAWHPTGNSIVSCDRNKHAIIWTDRY